MVDLEITAKELREELKAALDKWRSENPAPRLEIEPEPGLPEPIVLRTERQLVLIEVISGDLMRLHILDGNNNRKVEMNFKQLGELLEALHMVRQPMKEHKTWKHFYQEELTRHKFEDAAWQRRLMIFKESVKRRLGLLQDNTGQ